MNSDVALLCEAALAAAGELQSLATRLRVNLLRVVPDVTHDELGRIIDGEAVAARRMRHEAFTPPHCPTCDCGERGRDWQCPKCGWWRSSPLQDAAACMDPECPPLTPNASYPDRARSADEAADVPPKP